MTEKAPARKRLAVGVWSCLVSGEGVPLGWRNQQARGGGGLYPDHTGVGLNFRGEFKDGHREELGGMGHKQHMCLKAGRRG